MVHHNSTVKSATFYQFQIEAALQVLEYRHAFSDGNRVYEKMVLVNQIILY